MSKSDKLLFYYLWIIIAPLILISTTSGHYCEISDPETHIKYDLRELISNHTDTRVRTDSGNMIESIRLQLCSPLVNKCNGEDGYALCYVYNNGVEKGIAKFPPRVSNRDGRTIFKYQGAICSGRTNYKIMLSLWCDSKVGNNTLPVLINFHLDSCNIYMEWRTSLICPTRRHIDCTTAHNNELYDLTSLTKYDKNYEVNIENVSSEIILNVCHSVIHIHGINCSSEAGACLIDEKRKRYLNLGNVQKPPFFVNGHIWLEYQDGDLCDIADTTSHISKRYKTTIIFICSLSAEGSIPEHIRITEECHYEIVWYTPVACNISSLLKNESYIPGDCTVINPITKSMYNLQPLMNQDYDVKNEQNEYKISICGPLAHSKCLESFLAVGACNLSHDVPVGEANTALMWGAEGPYLHYYDGPRCLLEPVYISTIIKFICSRDPLAFGPEISEDVDCSLMVYFYTNLVCEEQIKCITDNTDEIDLTPLMRPTKNYIIKDEHTNVEYHINICRRLAPTPNLNCGDDSAACSVELDLDKQYQNEVSLGYLENSPTLNENRQVVLRYVGGGSCRENNYKFLSTNITFVCSNDQETPVYKNYVDCTYLFEWNTRLACRTMIGTWLPPCILEEKVFAHIYNLSTLYAEKNVHYVEGRQGREYSINICNKKEFCNGYGICNNKGDNYGSLHGVFFDYKQKEIRLEYLNGDQCSSEGCEHCENSIYAVQIIFTCNKSVGIGTPKIRMESECNVEFEWETELICTLNLVSQNITIGNGSQPIPIPMGESSSVLATNLIISFVVLIFVLVAVAVMRRYWHRMAWFRSQLHAYFQACISYFYDGRYENPAVRLNEDIYELSASQPTVADE